MKTNRNVKVLIVIILLILVGAMGLYYIEFRKARTEALKELEVTFFGKTYRNEQYGFEMRYPQSWQFSDTSNPLNEHIYSFYKIHEASVQIFPKVPLDDMMMLSRPESGKVDVGQKETFLFAGRQAVKRSSSGEGLRGLIITFPNLRIRIETNDGFNDFNAEIINQVLSTFKFIK